MVAHSVGWLPRRRLEPLPSVPFVNGSGIFRPDGSQCSPGDEDPVSEFYYSTQQPTGETREHHDRSLEHRTSARILVVEDEMIVALDLQNTLERMGYTVVGTACSGPEAIYMVARAQPNIVLMDINLNDQMDGIETAREICKQQETAIIYLTAQSDEKTLQRARNTGPRSLLLKPFTESTLQTALEAALSKTDD